MVLRAIGPGRNDATHHRSRTLQVATGHQQAPRGVYYAINLSCVLPREFFFPDGIYVCTCRTGIIMVITTYSKFFIWQP